MLEDAAALNEKGEPNFEQQQREASTAVQEAEEQLRALLLQLGQNSKEIQSLLNAIKRSPSDFTEDPGPAKKALAKAVLDKMSVEREFSEQLRVQQEKEAKSLRAIARKAEEAALFAKYAQLPNEPVYLNVGGELFTTSRKTLLAADEGSMFEVLYSWRHGNPPSPLFIDRDPKLFVHVLNFLRAIGSLQGPGEIIVASLSLPEESVSAAVAQEAQFFGLAKMEKFLEASRLAIFKSEVPQMLLDATLNVSTAQGLQNVATIMVHHAQDETVQKIGAEHLRSLIKSFFRTGGDMHELIILKLRDNQSNGAVCEGTKVAAAAVRAVRRVYPENSHFENFNILMGGTWGNVDGSFNNDCDICCKIH